MMLIFERARASRPFLLGKGHHVEYIVNIYGAFEVHQDNDQRA